MTKLFTPLAVLVAAMFAYAPVLILNAPYESTMGLVQKIFYFHVPAAMTLFLSAFVCGTASRSSRSLIISQISKSFFCF